MMINSLSCYSLWYRLVCRMHIFLFLLLLSCGEEEQVSTSLSVTTAVNPAEGGKIAPDKGEFFSGETVEFTAIPEEGWEFDSWTGDATGNDNPVEITMKKDIHLAAHFKRPSESIVIFSINDPHGKIHNFAKIKAIIDQEKEGESQVFFVSGGDIFSGNPIVDYHPEKGFPIIDLMGKAGMDVSAVGNHEFDYGQEILNKRMTQASFPFLCANLEKTDGTLRLPEGHVSIEKDGFEIAFISVVETGSHDNKPLSHPKKLVGLEFSEGIQAMEDYKDSEIVQKADLVVALTHYGSYGDRLILEEHDFVDLVVGGHNHAVYSRKVAGRYMIQSGSDLEILTRLELQVRDGEIVDYDYQTIDLNAFEKYDSALQEDIDQYNNIPEFYREIGISLQDHNTSETGCFYTDAIRTISGADLVFQNYGGIRAGLDYGTITPFDIYTIDPFGNGLDLFSMTVGQIESFLSSSSAPSLAYSGLRLERRDGEVNLYDSSGRALSDDAVIKVALNDYISNVHSSHFKDPIHTFEKTTAEYLIEYLEKHQSELDYHNCNRGF